LIEIFIDASVKENKTSFRFAGGTPGGFTGSGIVGRLNITATMPGSLEISLNESSQLLSGTGEPIEESDKKLKTATVKALQLSANAIIITSRSHPDQNDWYNKTDLHLRWDLEDNVEYSYLVSLDPLATPDNTPNKPEGTLLWQGDINIDGLSEGIYYFTLKRVGEDDIARYRAQIDTTPPEWIGFEKSEGVPETNHKDFLTFLAKDELSGIHHYEVSVDGSKPEIVLAPYILPDDYIKITVTAVDNAGNKLEKDVLSDTQKSIVAVYIIVGIIVLGGIVTLIGPVRRRIFTNDN